MGAVKAVTKIYHPDVEQVELYYIQPSTPFHICYFQIKSQIVSYVLIIISVICDILVFFRTRFFSA